jgi:hypothetical protein
MLLGSEILWGTWGSHNLVRIWPMTWRVVVLNVGEKRETQALKGVVVYSISDMDMTIQIKVAGDAVGQCMDGLKSIT